MRRSSFLTVEQLRVGAVIVVPIWLVSRLAKMGRRGRDLQVVLVSGEMQVHGHVDRVERHLDRQQPAKAVGVERFHLITVPRSRLTGSTKAMVPMPAPVPGSWG